MFKSMEEEIDYVKLNSMDDSCTNEMTEEEKKEFIIKNLYGFPMREKDRRCSEKRKVPELKRLWSRHKEILNLDSLGYKRCEIAKLLGITRESVSHVLNSILAKRAQEAIRLERDLEYKALREAVMDLTWKSLEVYEDILNSEEANMRLKKQTADTIMLELSGMRVPTRIDSRNINMTLTPEEIEEFKRRGIEAARMSGKLVEVDGVD